MRAAPLLAAAAIVALAGCSTRPAGLPPPVDAAEYARAQAAVPREPPPPEPPPARVPRLPPNPEMIALPTGPLPTPSRAPAEPAPEGTATRAPTVAQRRGDVPQPPPAVAVPVTADGCVMPTDAVRVVASANQPPVVTSEGRVNLAASSNAPRPTGFQHVAGTYRSRFGHSLQLRIGRQGDCNVPQVTLNADLTRTIYVASEYPAGTCRHAVALAHEREHAAIDDALLRDIDAWLASPLRRVLAEPGALRADPHALAARLRARYQEAATAFAEARQRAQLSIDTVDEYRRLTAACPGQG